MFIIAGADRDLSGVEALRDGTANAIDHKAFAALGEFFVDEWILVRCHSVKETNPLE